MKLSSSAQPTLNISSFFKFFLCLGKFYLHLKLCVFYGWDILYIHFLFTIFITIITIILVLLAITSQKDPPNSFSTNSTHLESYFFINISHYINLNILREQPLYWKNIHDQIMFSQNFKAPAGFSHLCSTHSIQRRLQPNTTTHRSL